MPVDPTGAAHPPFRSPSLAYLLPTLACLTAAVAFGLAALFAHLWRKEALCNTALRSLAVDYERKFNAAHAAAGEARSAAKVAEAALEAARRSWAVDRTDFEMRLGALRQANEELRRGRPPEFRP